MESTSVCNQTCAAIPAISVVMAVHNGAEYLTEAIDSVLAQTFSNFEFIIIDDASTDITPIILKKYAEHHPRLRLAHNTINKKLAASLNIGIGMARAPLIARMDADDVAHPERFAKQYAFMQAHPEVTVCGTGFKIYESGEVCAAPETDRVIRTHLFFNASMAHPTVIYRKDVIMRLAGGYDETMPAAQDYDLWSRLAEYPEVTFANIPEILLQYRTFPDKDRKAYLAKQIAAAQRVRQRILARLGIEATDDQMRVHALLCGGRCVHSLRDFTDCVRWSKYVLQKNSVCHVYPQDIFHQMMAERIKALWGNISKGALGCIWVYTFFKQFFDRQMGVYFILTCHEIRQRAQRKASKIFLG